MYGGDGGAATATQLYFPYDVTLDGSGNLYIAVGGNNRIRKVDTAGIITTVAGNGERGYGGDGGSATAAKLYFPQGVAVDGSDNLYIADTGNNRIRKGRPDGIITTVAGNGERDFAATAVRRPRRNCTGPEAWRWTGRATSTLPMPATTAFARSTPTGTFPPSRAAGRWDTAGTAVRRPRLRRN